MRKNKNNYAVWSTRIKKQTSNNFKKVGSSINIDKRLYKEDIRGSMVHTDMLYKQKIISHMKINVPTFKKNKLPKSLKSIPISKPGSRHVR